MATQHKSERICWHVGQRVARKNSDELGYVVDVGRDTIKVNWDRGSTSYYRPEAHAKIKLVEQLSR
jgi:hypothetical protein